MNHTQFEERLTFVKSTLDHVFGIRPSKITPVEYDEKCPFPYNNFIYLVELPPSTKDIKATITQPGTVPLPDDVSSFIIRLSNPAAGLNDTNRIENEVAIMGLFQEALRSFNPPIVPEVYAWGSAANGAQGWTIQQYMPGIMKDEAFKTMDASSKAYILQQMAEVLVALQKYEIPESIKDFGGLTFDEGKIISAQMTLLKGGPFGTYKELYQAILRFQLVDSEGSSLLKGWEIGGVRKRVETFIANGLDPVFANLEADRKVLIHGDFTTNNLLFDKDSLRLTAMLDFDWSHISNTSDEFFRSFNNTNGSLPGPFSEDPTHQALRRACLEGFPAVMPDSVSGEQWEQAKLWDEALVAAGAVIPRIIRGIEELSGLFAFSEKLCPFMLWNENALKRKSAEELDVARREAEDIIVGYLEQHGF